MTQDFAKFVPRCVFLTTTGKEFVSQTMPKIVKPSVMIGGRAHPDVAGMVLVCDLVAGVGPGAVRHTMSGRQQLSILDHHFGAVNIGMVDGCLLRTGM